jgi:hypothetical protein
LGTPVGDRPHHQSELACDTREGSVLVVRTSLIILIVLVAFGLAGAEFATKVPELRHLTRQTTATQPPANRAERPRPRSAPVAHRTDTAASTISRVGSTAGTVSRDLLLVLAAVSAALLGTRWLARRSRTYVRLRLMPYRADDAEPDAVRRLAESWHQQLLERWWRRLVFGQPGMALEVVMTPDPSGELNGELAIVCPRELAPSIEGSLLACYPDSHLVRRDSQLPDVSAVIRLKKRHGFVRALRNREELQATLVDNVLNVMASLKAPAVLQYTLVPAPAVFDRFSRWRYGSLERSGEPTADRRPPPRSEALGQELEGGLRVQHHPLFFADIRIAARSYGESRAIAGAVRGASGAENRLVERRLRSAGRSDLYLRRLYAGVGNPIPSWRKSVVSSEELSGLWQLPSPGLKRVRIERSPVPRVPAPPEISRAAEHTLARDEHGSVGIRPEDKTDGLGLIGGQKTGKTSVLCRTVRADALDEDCALIVLMPKPGDAMKALSMVPGDRVAHYLDLEHPEFGINPLLADGDPAMVADKVVEAFRDVNMEGDIRGSSDRYLRQAAQASIGASRAGLLEGPPTLWHMYRMLLPNETTFRERVVHTLLPEPRYADTATFFGRELPYDLTHAAGQTTAKLDAPRNKLLRVMVESLDKVLRHPLQMSLDDIVSRREVLIVDGKMGTFGSDNCRVMMQFILNSLYGTLQRQQQLPEHERTRVALKVDEAHLVINESFADALATLRSAGLEVVAAWQYGEQIQDPKIRSGMMSLLRQRCMFSMGEEADAREMTTIAMSVYTDMIRTDSDSRSRLRLTPDTIFNLPNHHAICSWISRGARVPAFIAQTLPLESDDEVVRHHLEAQRARGYYVPERLPDPLPDLDWKGLRELPTEVVATNGHANGAVVNIDFDPGATSIVDANERPAKPPVGAPDTFTELDLDDVRGIVWDKATPLPPDKRPDPTHRELEILAALWSHRFLFASQIWRRWWSGTSQRAAQQGLNRMHSAGWVRRFKFRLGERGAQQRVYALTRLGFDLGQQHSSRRGPYIDPQATWRESQVGDPRRVLRDLHVNGWVLALEQVAGKAFAGWRGQRAARLEPPRRRVRGEWIELSPSEVTLGSNHVLRDYQPQKFEPVTPDAAVEIRLQVGGERMHLELLVEMDRGRSSMASEERLRRYDGLVSGWGQALDRYRTMGAPPMVVFVSEDEPSALALVKVADRALTARIAKAGTDELSWPFPGRRAVFFAVERDVHSGSLLAFQVPEHPPELRVRLNGNKARACEPRRVHLIEPRLLRR